MSPVMPKGREVFPGVPMGRRQMAKSSVPAPTTRTIKAEGVGGWGYDPNWAGDKGEGTNAAEERAAKAFDRKRKEERIAKRYGRDETPTPVKSPAITRTMIGHAIARLKAGKGVRNPAPIRPAPMTTDTNGHTFKRLDASSNTSALYPNIDPRVKAERPAQHGPVKQIEASAPSTWGAYSIARLARLRGK